MADNNTEKIKNLRKQGYNIDEIANMLNIDEVEVYNIVAKGNKIITEDQRKEMILLRATGKSYREIASIIGCSESTVRNRIKSPAKYKAPKNYYKINEDDLEEIKSYYLKGKTLAWIAEKYQISPASVLTRLTNAGVYQKGYNKTVPLTIFEKFLIQFYHKIGKHDIDYICDKIGRTYATVSDYLDVFDRTDNNDE